MNINIYKSPKLDLDLDSGTPHTNIFIAEQRS